jgi:hypothetical protein
MRKSWPWLVVSTRNKLHWNRSLIHVLTWLLQYNNGTSYQTTCKQSHIPRFQELARCAKTSGTTSMVIISAFQITTQALGITLHTRIWHWKSETNSICQSNTMNNVIMQLRFSRGREESMFQSMWGICKQKVTESMHRREKKGKNISLHNQLFNLWCRSCLLKMVFLRKTKRFLNSTKA